MQLLQLEPQTAPCCLVLYDVDVYDVYECLMIMNVYDVIYDVMPRDV